MKEKKLRKNIIGVRVSDEEHELISNAAEKEKRELSNFMRISLIERAERVLDEQA